MKQKEIRKHHPNRVIFLLTFPIVTVFPQNLVANLFFFDFLILKFSAGAHVSSPSAVMDVSFTISLVSGCDGVGFTSTLMGRTLSTDISSIEDDLGVNTTGVS